LLHSDTTKIEYIELELGLTKYSVKSFRKNLDDGIWLYCPGNKADTGHCLSNYELRGNYIRGLKNGEFIIKNSTSTFNDYFKLNYKDGLLDGQVVNYVGDRKSFEGFYKNGMMDGLFINFVSTSIDNRIESFQYYSEDSLMSWTIFSAEGKLKSQGVCSNLKSDCKCLFYDLKGNIVSIGYFKKRSLNRVQFIDPIHGVFKELEGEFFQQEAYQFSSRILRIIGFSKIKLVNGFIREYKDGVLINEKTVE